MNLWKSVRWLVNELIKMKLKHTSQRDRGYLVVKMMQVERTAADLMVCWIDLKAGCRNQFRNRFGRMDSGLSCLMEFVQQLTLPLNWMVFRWLRFCLYVLARLVSDYFCLIHLVSPRALYALFRHLSTLPYCFLCALQLRLFFPYPNSNIFIN